MNPAWLDAVVLLTTGPSSCTGTIVEPSGTILTAYHCVANGLRSDVALHDGRVFRGRTIAADPLHDLALVEVPELGPDAIFLPISASDPAQASEVWAVGHPFASAATGPLEGTLKWSVTRGVVSAVGSTFIQTDAALNPGNSGGPLIGGAGEIIGVVSRKLNADNLSFATRSALAVELLRERTRPPVLGGTYGVAVALVPRQDHAYALAGELTLVAKERGWLRLQVGGSLADDPNPCARMGLGLRQRIGSGPLSTALDLGGAWTLEAPTNPEVVGRLTLAGVGLGGMWAPGTGVWGVELAANLPFHGVW